jgi:ureidoacrylate peracid hydrolase
MAPQRGEIALVVIDMQNAFCSSRGSYRRRGGKIADLARVIARTGRLLELARRNRRPVVFTRLVFRRDYSDAGSFLLRKFPEIARVGGYRARSWDAALHPRLAARRGEIVVDKTGYDAFVRTELERALARRRVSTVVVTGVLTNVCVESFARAAFDRGLEPIVARDATATYSRTAHASSLRAMARHFADVVSSEHAAALLERDVA